MRDFIKLMFGIEAASQYVPQPDCAVIRCRRHRLPIWREDHRRDPAGMALQLLHTLACVRLPQPDCSVIRRRRHCLPVSREDHHGDAVGMALKYMEAGIPFLLVWPRPCDPSWNFVIEQTSS